jgi:hypothetical protein
MVKSLSIKELLINMTRHICKLEEKIDTIDDRTKSYPKLYDNVDKIVGEIIENRQERTFITQKMQNHESRLNKLEKQF